MVNHKFCFTRVSEDPKKNLISFNPVVLFSDLGVTQTLRFFYRF